MDEHIESNPELTDSGSEARAPLSEFMARAAYAIRSPINIILGYNELIAQRLAALGDDSQRPYLESIRRSGRQILATINRIVDYSQIEEGSLRLVPERIEVDSLAERLAQDYRVLAAAKKLGLICEISEPNAAVRCDAYCLTNALSNLIDNAIKFTHRGGAVVKVCRDGHRRLCVEVRDTGVGFDPEGMIRSLDPHRDAGEPRERSGLGLMLARKYLDLIGASLAMSSSPGKGSVFTISFPPSIEAVGGPARRDGGDGHGRAELSTAAGLRPEQAPREAGAQAVVLVVEDQPDQALFMRALLQNRYEVVVATSALETLARLEELGDRVGLILMDVSLSQGEDGLMLTRQIRSDKRWQHLPIVIASAHAFEEDRTRALAAGAAAYLAKPIDAAELLATIGRLRG
jgi:CheY-like chemotaxis protein